MHGARLNAVLHVFPCGIKKYMSILLPFIVDRRFQALKAAAKMTAKLSGKTAFEAAIKAGASPAEAAKHAEAASGAFAKSKFLTKRCFSGSYSSYLWA